MNVEANSHTSTGYDITIDVQPSFQPIMMVLFYYASLWYGQLDQRSHAKVSPMTLVAYFLNLLYAHILLNDVYVRPTASHHASEFMDTTQNAEYVRFLAGLPVPTFLTKLLDILTPTTDPRRPGLSFTPSFACFSHNHDFGRLFPVNLFIIIHNAATRANPRSDPSSTLEYILGRPVMRIGAQTFAIGNFFGLQTTEHNAPTFLSNKLNQGFLSLINPVLARSITARHVFSQAPLETFSSQSTNYNPYNMLLAASPDNLPELQALFESVALAFDGILPLSGTLATNLDSQSGLEILRHAYSDYDLPTWSCAAIKQTAPTDTSTYDTIPSTQRATNLNFLTAPTYVKSVDVPAAHAPLSTILYLVDGNKAQNNPVHFPLIRDFVLFNAKDQYPRLLVFDAYDPNPSSAHTPAISGLIIETYEVDASIVTHPDPRSTLDDTNSQVLQSAVSLASIKTAIRFGTTNDVTHVLPRARTDAIAQKASTILYDASENWLGKTDTENAQAIPTTLPYFIVNDHLSWFEYMSNKFGQLIRTIDNKSLPSVKPKTDLHPIVAWSPYRYRSNAHTREPMERIYMLLNFRTIYGTNVTLIETPGYQTSIPIH